jgi:hypothetical protein
MRRRRVQVAEATLQRVLCIDCAAACQLVEPVHGRNGRLHGMSDGQPHVRPLLHRRFAADLGDRSDIANRAVEIPFGRAVLGFCVRDVFLNP